MCCGVMLLLLIYIYIAKATFTSASCDTILHTPTMTMIRIEVASSRPDYLPTFSAAKTSKLSLLVKHHILAIDEAS